VKIKSCFNHFIWCV